MAEALLSVRDLKKWFLQEPGFLASLWRGGSSLAVRAVDGISFSISEGEILGLAGESGCGKSTTGMTLVKLYEPSGGEIRFQGEDISSFQGRDLKAYRRRAQIIFQNPYESLNPRMTVLDAVSEPWKIHGEADKRTRAKLVARALERSGLAPPREFFQRFPHELSGGQRQRVAIARAIVLEPKFLVADEPVSMLDVSIRAGVLKLLWDFSRKLGMAIVYISHDLSTIRQICDRLAIMYLGKIVEIGPTEEVIQNPAHPYARALIAAVPVPDPESFRPGPQIDMEVPSALDVPSGCRFHPRCSGRNEDCSKLEPSLQEISPRHHVACDRAVS